MPRDRGRGRRAWTWRMRIIVIWRTHFARGKHSLLEMTVPDSSDRQTARWS